MEATFKPRTIAKVVMRVPPLVGRAEATTKRAPAEADAPSGSLERNQTTGFALVNRVRGPIDVTTGTLWGKPGASLRASSLCGTRWAQADAYFVAIPFHPIEPSITPAHLRAS